MTDLENLERLAFNCTRTHNQDLDFMSSKEKRTWQMYKDFCTPELILRLCQLARGQEWVEISGLKDVPVRKPFLAAWIPPGESEPDAIEWYIFDGTDLWNLNSNNLNTFNNDPTDAPINRLFTHISEPPIKPDAGGVRNGIIFEEASDVTEDMFQPTQDGR